jgi:SAM-dependent methyltransferase
MSEPADSPPQARTIAPPHPLALRLLERLRARARNRVLDFSSGSGRNALALRRAGLAVVEIDDRAAASQRPFAGVAGPFTGTLSTHGLLHGTPATIAANLVGIAGLLEPEGLLYGTFGSMRDARFGRGERVAEFAYALDEGDERGVAHTFYDRQRLSALLRTHFAVESLEEHVVDGLAGRWAHRESSLSGAVHWFAVATVR